MIVVFVFCDGGVSLYSLGWPRNHSVDQADFILIEICLPLPSEYWDQLCAPPHWMKTFFWKNAACL